MPETVGATAMLTNEKNTLNMRDDVVRIGLSTARIHLGIVYPIVRSGNYHRTALYRLRLELKKLLSEVTASKEGLPLCSSSSPYPLHLHHLLTPSQSQIPPHPSPSLVHSAPT